MPQSKGQKIEALYHESEKFRKDTVLKWKKALVGSYTVKHMDQDLLISILRWSPKLGQVVKVEFCP